MAGYDEFYRLSSLGEILGNESAVGKLRKFASDIDNGKARQPLLVYGPAGTGKTASVHLLSEEHGWNLVEMGANDYRDKASIERRLIAAATSRSMRGSRNVIVLDEIDELASGFDKGAASAVGELIQRAHNPVIFVANSMWDQSITFLRGKTDPVEFKRLPAETIAALLQRVCARAGASAERGQIETISQRSNGDARSAINDLFAVAGAKEDATDVLGMRDRKIDVFELLDKIFYANSASAPLRAIMSTDLTNDMLISWLDENIPRRYLKVSEMRSAFSALGRATIFATRAVRSQYYTYWRYMNACMSSGIALAKEEYPSRRFGYAFPQRIKALSGSKESRKLSATIAKRLQRAFHASVKDIVRGELEIIAAEAGRKISKEHAKQEDVIDRLMSDYGLDEKEAKGVVELHA